MEKRRKETREWLREREQQLTDHASGCARLADRVWTIGDLIDAGPVELTTTAPDRRRRFSGN
jgi:hypothetical protein